MRRRRHFIVMLGLLAAMATGASAQDVPYQPAYPKNPDQTNGARIYVPPRLYPSVEVSRTLAAQPVHPHLVQVSLGGSGYSGPICTYIDPMARIEGEGKLDESHSLVKAQRLYRSLRGVTTEQLNAVRNDSLRREPNAAGANHAVIYVSPMYYRPAVADDTRDIQTVTSPGTPSMPDRPRVQPKTQPEKRFDLKVQPELPRPAEEKPMLVDRSQDQ